MAPELSAPQHRHAGLAHGPAAQLPAQHSQHTWTLGTLYGGVPEGGGAGRHLLHRLHDHHGYDYYLTFILYDTLTLICLITGRQGQKFILERYVFVARYVSVCIMDIL